MEKFFTFIFQLLYLDGLLWHFHGMLGLIRKTRKCCFQTIYSHRSLALSTVATWLPTGLLGVPPILAEMWLLPQKVVLLNWAKRTGGYGPAIAEVVIPQSD